jgi:hypothetical protein
MPGEPSCSRRRPLRSSPRTGLSLLAWSDKARSAVAAHVRVGIGAVHREVNDGEYPLATAPLEQCRRATWDSEPARHASNLFALPLKGVVVVKRAPALISLVVLFSLGFGFAAVLHAAAPSSDPAGGHSVASRHGRTTEAGPTTPSSGRGGANVSPRLGPPVCPGPPLSPPVGPPLSPPVGPPLSPPVGPPLSPPVGPPLSPPVGPPLSPPVGPPLCP